MPQRSRINTVTDFLGPSTVSVGVSLLIYVIIVLERFLPTLLQPFGAISITQLHGTWLYRVGHDINSILALQSVGSVVFFGFWLVIGVVVYMSLHLLSEDFHQLFEAVEERHYVFPSGANRNRALESLASTGALRLSIIALSLFYVRFLLHLYVQWLHGHHVHEGFWHSLLTYGWLLVTTLILLQVLVVGLRLFMLRRRIFGAAQEL